MREANLIDALIIATVAGMLSWVFLMEPQAYDQSRPLLERLISIAYPLMDLVVLVAALQLWLISEKKKRLGAHYLLNVSLVFLLLADTWYATTLLTDTYETGHLLDGGWLLFFVLFGAAALHPSMVALSVPRAPSETRLTWGRLALLTATSLVAPVLLIYQAIFEEEIDVPVIAGGSVVLFVLVAARMAGMISHRRQVEQALQENERRFRSSFRDAAIGMALVATEGRWLQVNRSLCRIVGYSEQELLKKTFQDITHPDDLEADLGYVDQLLAGEIDTYQMEQRYVHKEGHVVWVLLSVSLVRDARDAPLYLVVQVQDVTERKRAEESLKTYATRLRRSNRELRDFANVASHDLQEPLRKIRTFSDRLKSKYANALDEQGHDYLERMESAAARMQDLIDDLLTLSRVTTQARPFEPVDLGEVAKEVLSDLEARIEHSGGQVEVGEMPTVEADRAQMRQLLQNLIGNALKFHKEGETPVVKIHNGFLKEEPNGSLAEGRAYQIVVEDNGIGFEEKHLERIFGPFQRLHGRAEYEGTGMGLAICRKVVERHGGEITAKSSPGRGATFIVTLPVKQLREKSTVERGEVEDHVTSG